MRKSRNNLLPNLVIVYSILLGIKMFPKMVFNNKSNLGFTQQHVRHKGKCG